MPIIKPQVLNQNPFVASFDAVLSIACRCQQSSSGEGCVTPKSADRAAERKRNATVFTRLTGPTLDVTGRTFILSDSSAFQTCSVSCFPDAHVKENSTGLAERPPRRVVLRLLSLKPPSPNHFTTVMCSLMQRHSSSSAQGRVPAPV